MPPLRTLPPEIANKIAAGEVVERPASVVKELIENALDAGPGQISVDIEDGGRGLIRVSDDGGGIDPAEAPLLFEAHTTSKLEKASDLFCIRTLGFRGEALSSLGSVARVRLASRRRGDLAGFEILCDGGKKEPPKPSACHEGTLVEARHLFFNVPARRKFLKSAPVETDHVREIVRRLALCYPKIAFRLSREAEPDLTLAAAEDLRGRAAAILDPGVAQDLIPVERTSGSIQLRGLLAPPRHSRTTSAGEYVFVNGRFVRDRVLARALHDAYREFLVSGRYAVACLFLTLPPDRVDVNVHPAKAEVRFADGGSVYELVFRTVRDALGVSPLEPRLRAEELEPKVEDRITRFFSDAPADVTPPLPRLQIEQRYFQLHHKYLVQEIEDGILIIDQHALHERVILEKLRAGYHSSDLVRQKLLLPAVVQVSEHELGVLEAHRRVLESAGLEFEPFGRSSARVSAVPAMLDQESAELLIRDFLDLVREQPCEPDELVPIERVLEMVACRGAIRFGRSLPTQEIEALLAQRETLVNPHSCAHGRPVAIKLTLEELEKFFRRK